MTGRVGVVVTTYRWPEALRLALTGYACQQRPPDEVVVADDGSGPETAAVVRELAGTCGFPLRHVWQEDRGFRKTEILNRAIRATRCEYLVFTDGDCVPRRDFLAVHAGLARPGRFLSGGCVRLGPAASAALTPEAVRSGRAFSTGWLRAHEPVGARRSLRLLPAGTLPGLLDAVTPTRATWNGMGSSTWREALERVNGFDLELVHGGLDRELGARLQNAGLRGRQVRHRAVLLHLHHERPWADPAAMARQRAYRALVRRTGRVRAIRGLSEVDAPVPPPRGGERA
ncbi:MAG: glycosyltransferase family 2 protein [Longimicrobiales bacterium]|nr:glycosyltransferase family 2 protein [Longimicrobiales bacterium]